MPSAEPCPHPAASFADADEPFGAYVFSWQDPLSEPARRLETQVFLEAFGNTSDLLSSEYGPYDQSSLFVCVVDHVRGVPAGMMRVLTPSPRGFKSLIDIEQVWGEPLDVVLGRTGLVMDTSRTWDIATLAVAPDYRGTAAQGLVTMGLYQTLTLAAFRHGIRWFVAILDLPVFRLLRLKLRMIFSEYEGLAPLPYLGSPQSVPAWCDVTAAADHLAVVDTDLYDIVVRGVGLEPALRRADLSALSPSCCPSESRARLSLPRPAHASTTCRRGALNAATTSGSLRAPTGREYR